MNLLSKLELVCAAWVAACQRSDARVSLKTLGVRATGNSKLFDRRDMMTGTYESVLSFLGNPANWPLALVPADAADMLASLGLSIPDENRVQLDAAA